MHCGNSYGWVLGGDEAESVHSDSTSLLKEWVLPRV